jgi:hypothetical protein
MFATMSRTKAAEGILDCESLDSALISLSGLFGVKKRDLRSALTHLRPKEFEASIGPTVEWSTALWNEIVGTGEPAPVPRVIHWFHATRVSPGTDFKEGILPLNLILPTLLPLRGGPRGFQYELKTRNSMHWGPYAFLVRDAIVRRDPVTHDYLETPEIVEDYYNGGSGTEEFRTNTKPCIVKFRSLERRTDVTKVALSYCYAALWGMGTGLNANTHFDGEGRTVPRSDIIIIEYPKVIRLNPFKWYD